MGQIIVNQRTDLTIATARIHVLPPELLHSPKADEPWRQTMRYQALLQLQVRLVRHGMTAPHALLYAYTLWLAGDDLDRPVSFSQLRMALDESRQNIQKKMGQLIEAGVVTQREMVSKGQYLWGFRPYGETVLLVERAWKRWSK